jgi:hypothetical protein
LLLPISYLANHTVEDGFDRIHGVEAVISCAGNAAFKRFPDLTDTDYELGLRRKLMGQPPAERPRRARGFGGRR